MRTPPLTRLRQKVMFRMILIIGFLNLIIANNLFSQEPAVTARFANPEFDYVSQTYHLDVEFQCDMPAKELFGMNVRFFYEDDILEFIAFDDFAESYGAVCPDPPIIATGTTYTGETLFGFTGPQEYINGAIQKISNSATVTLSTTGWTKLFGVLFSIDDPNVIDIESFCPSAVWDLNEDASGGINPAGGIIITTVVSYPNLTESAIELCEQFNWVYDGIPGNPHGYPAAIDCISTMEPSQIPDFLSLQNITVTEGQNDCENALQNIIVAGDNTYYIVEAGASVTMIAGQSILLLPGTLIDSGSYFLGTITTTSNYCGAAQSAVVSAPVQEEAISPLVEGQHFAIFPNPTSGKFTLLFDAPVESRDCYLQVAGLRGEKIISTPLEFSDRFEFDLSGQNRGIYIVQLIQGEHIETIKLIKQ